LQFSFGMHSLKVIVVQLALLAVAASGTRLTCNFEMYNWNGFGPLYTCRAQNPKFIEPNMQFTSVIGTHMSDKTNADVRIFMIDSAQMDILPQSPSNLFPNYNIFLAFHTGIRNISRADLVTYKHLNSLSFWDSRFSRFDEDTFSDMTNLQYLSISASPYKTLPTGLFRGMPKLKEIYMFGSQLTALQSGLFQNNRELEVISVHTAKVACIGRNVFTGLNKLRDVDLDGNACVDMKFPKDVLKDPTFAVDANCPYCPE